MIETQNGHVLLELNVNIKHTSCCSVLAEIVTWIPKVLTSVNSEDVLGSGSGGRGWTKRMELDEG